jgi:hypothetical protein
MNIPLELLHPLLAAVLAYLIGSVSFAVVVSRVMGLSDPRSYGSHNPGATNVLRSGNKLAALLTLLLDGVKGWLPVYAVVQFGAAYGLGQGSVALVALAAFLGHVWPVFFRFQGGKGVATAAGVFWHRALVGPGHLRHLVDRGVLLALLVFGGVGQRGVCARLLFPWPPRGLVCRRLRAAGRRCHERHFGVAAPGQYRQADAR